MPLLLPCAVLPPREMVVSVPTHVGGLPVPLPYVYSYLCPYLRVGLSSMFSALNLIPSQDFYVFSGEWVGGTGYAVRAIVQAMQFRLCGAGYVVQAMQYRLRYRLCGTGYAV